MFGRQGFLRELVYFVALDRLILRVMISNKHVELVEIFEAGKALFLKMHSTNIKTTEYYKKILSENT